jgi:hypothetical protein
MLRHFQNSLRTAAAVLLAGGLLALAACNSDSPEDVATPTPVITTAAPSPDGTADAVLVGAGDIARNCVEGDDLENSEATAKLIDAIPGEVFAAGDLAYEDGTAEQFSQCYDATWGRHKARTHAVPGNHDYHTEGGAGYHGYFGAAAGEPGKGYYSFDAGAWHVIVLNSNCEHVGGCDPNSEQYHWLQDDLAASEGTACIAALWHHPVFTAGPHEDDEGGMTPIFQLLYDVGADLVVSGHEHYYQRWAPITPTGEIDTVRGMRQFVVGTGGRNHTKPERSPDSLELLNNETYGVLKLTLHAVSYDWEFVPVDGSIFTDSGTQACH